MTHWGLEMALTTKTAQDAVEEVYEAAPRLLAFPGERDEINEALATICELMGLSTDFLEESEE
jgi:hypothetical protein